MRDRVPIGLVLGHIGKGELLAISISNVGRAVPSLALIAFFVAYLGVGFTNVMLALVLLAIPPILTNTYVGVRQVDPDMIDAGARHGPDRRRRSCARIELPLALTIIFGGIRTSAVNVVATATIAPLAGVLTLGDPILERERLRRRRPARRARSWSRCSRCAVEVALRLLQRAVDAARAASQTIANRAGIPDPHETRRTA